MREVLALVGKALRVSEDRVACTKPWCGAHVLCCGNFEEGRARLVGGRVELGLVAADILICLEEVCSR